MALVAVLAWAGLATGVIDGPRYLIIYGLVGAAAGGVTVWVMNRRARKRRSGQR